MATWEGAVKQMNVFVTKLLDTVMSIQWGSDSWLESPLVMACLMAVIITLVWLNRPGRRAHVYMVDFSCFKPNPKNLFQCSIKTMLQKAINTGMFSEESLAFQRKVLERATVSDETYGPPALLREPPEITMAGSREEAELVMFGALDDLFAKTGVLPTEVDVVITNCSLFCPTPSLASMIVNRYGMRADVRTFNLGGMGCSAGAISTDLARRLLLQQSSPTKASFVVVLSTENITQAGYTGNDRAKLLPNCIFRMGGAAILLTNNPGFRYKSKYRLLHTVRTHMGANDSAYGAIYMEEDDHGKVGVTLSKEIKTVAAVLMKNHMGTLGPLVLPISEQLHFAFDFVMRKTGVFSPKSPPYVPDFRQAFDHFCVHAGGKAVLDSMEHHLNLPKEQMEASRMTLYRFGNTSSSSPWYELGFAEVKGRVRKDDRVWQLTFGSGFKCNSAVWVALKSVPAKEKHNVWSDIVDDLPDEIPAFRPA